VRRVTEASRVEHYLDQAFTVACSGRPGPVALLLPADLLMLDAVPGRRTLRVTAAPLDRPVAASDAVAAAARLLAEAKRPLVIAGGGVHGSQATSVLVALQEVADLPVATTVMGKGSVDETHPLSVGVIGYFMGPNSATRHQRRLVEEADIILLVGTRTNQNGTDSWKLYPTGAQYIHIDVDGSEIGRNYEAVRLVGDARATLAALTESLGGLDLSARHAARAGLARSIAAGRAAYLKESAAVRLSAARPVRPERVMHELQKRLYPNSIVAADASYSSIWVANYLTALAAGMRFLTPRGLAGLGWGFPMALGAKLAAPAATVWCVAGDGGFAHVWSALETAVRMKIKVVLIVLNNGILAYQKHAENVKFGAHTGAVDLCPVDHAAIARACGCGGIRVEDPAQLAAAFDEAEQAASTTLIDVVCDPDAFPPITYFTPGA
jgi:acetolactate synthase I/II/III large subunit